MIGHLPRRIGGILGALLALMVQVAIGATVPRPDPVAVLYSAETLCHSDVPHDGSDHKPSPLDCLVCTQCVALHAAQVALPDVPVLRPPLSGIMRLDGPSVRVTSAPPSPRRPVQPRAPPIG